jgi:hypothetical protein
MKRKLILIFLVGVLLAASAFATGINVFINDSAIKNKGGSSLPDGTYHPYASKLQFFYNSLPAPNAAGTRLPVDLATEYTHIGGQHKYQKSALNGGTLHVRVWDGAIAQQGSYYGKTSNSPSSGTTLPKDWVIASLLCDYKADVPYAPTIGTIGESLQRSGDDLELTLVIPVVYSASGPDGKREITGRSLRITFPDNTTETRNGTSITLSNTPSGNYTFVPIATNWFGQTEGTPVNYATLGISGGGAVGPITYNLITGINAISILHDVPFTVDTPSPSSVPTAGELVTAINVKAGANVVTAVGILTDNAIQGAYVTYDQTGNPTFTPTAGFADGANTTLVRGMSMQISVTADVTVTFNP